MTNLMTLTADNLTALERRVREVCVVYPNHPLPPGCNPAAADIGLENTADQSTLLQVRRGVVYSGVDSEVDDWVATGTRVFPSTGQAVDWLCDRLAAGPAAADVDADRARESEPPMPARQPPMPARLNAEEVTDLAGITLPAAPAPTVAGLEQILANEVLGQNNAIHGIAELAAFHIAKSRPRRPASALLIGPTGTGKTLAAEQLSAHLTSMTNSEWSYQRVDMNEFSERHSASRLFGAPPGYVGYNDGNDLAASLRTNPQSVILFDEIDKAHPQLWHSLMNFMDTGRFSGRAGDIDARRAILLFTSNKDARAIQPVASQGEDRLRAFLRERDYPPEIVARMSRILIFRPLTVDITSRLLVLTVQRVVESYGFTLAHIAPEAVMQLAAAAPLTFGGRDVEYHVDRILAPHLAQLDSRRRVVNIAKNMEVSSD